MKVDEYSLADLKAPNKLVVPTKKSALQNINYLTDDSVKNIFCLR